ncbi:MAG: lysophospholipid acyltransferase family protein [Pseudomonadota bacterium]
MTIPVSRDYPESPIGSVLFKVLFYLWTVMMLLVALPALILPKSVLFRAARFWARGILVIMRVTLGTKVFISGREHRPRGTGLLAVKHQSPWETIIFFLECERPVFILKQELIRLPLFGIYAQHMGMIAVDRSGGARALKAMLGKAKAAYAAGSTLIIFPEGTRGDVGKRYAYQPGVAALAKYIGAPVVPVGLTSGLVWSRNGPMRRGGRIDMAYGSQIPPAANKAEMLQAIETAVEGLTANLINQPEDGT